MEPIPTQAPTIEPIPAPTPTAKHGITKITIGNLTDMTGAASIAMRPMTMALEDLVEYYNDQNFIPGIEFEVITYDTSFSLSRDLPGYESLKDQGADLIFTAISSATTTLKPLLEIDKMVLFSVAPTEEALVPPGYIFCPGVALGKNVSYTLLKWIAENDPDFPEDRPAKIGGAAWNDSYSNEFLSGVEEYAKTHPDQYEWSGGYLTDLKFIWDTEVEALKDCDYLMPPITSSGFVKTYHSAGYTAKYIGTDAHISFFGSIDDPDIWGALDGMLFSRPSRWWNEGDELVNLAKSLLSKNHPDEAEHMFSSGSAYLMIYPLHVIFSLIAEAVEAVGPENLNSQAVYEAAKSFSLTTDGIELNSFDETKRASSNYLGMYELDSSQKDMVRVQEDWIPIVWEP